METIGKACTARDIIRHTHRLVSAIDRIADITLREEADLSLSHFRIMLAVHKKLVSQQDIAAFWGITPAAVSRQIHILKEKKLLTEITFGQEQASRKHMIGLTRVGMQKMEKMYFLVDQVFEKAFSDIPAKDKMLTWRTIMDMRNALASHPAIKKLDELCDGNMKKMAKYKDADKEENKEN